MKNNLDIILQEFNNQNRDDLEIIKAVLPHCSHHVKVSFALHCALDIEPLMADKRSTNALRAVELFLRTGTKVSQEVIDAAYAANATNAAYAAAAYAAYAAANATNATNAAAYAANAAATATNAAAEQDPNIYKDKLRSYLNKLKELVSMEYSVELTTDAAWLMAVVI